jgi:hypothetical protein
MKNHPYLRAYMAGILTPSLFLLVVLTVFILVRLVFQVSIPLERVIVFPMALVPNLFGLWNILYVWFGRRMPIGFHGALLPLIMAPLGALIAKHFGVFTFGAQGITFFQQITTPYSMIVPWVFGEFCVTLVAYYLVWKYIVGSLNKVLEIA